VNPGACEHAATKHFHAIRRPVIRSFQPGERPKWCYVDEAMWE